MNKQKITKFLQLFVVIPMLTLAAPLTGFAAQSQPTTTPAVVLSSTNTPADASTITTTEVDADTKAKADTLDAFFASYDSPLEGYGIKFVQEADKNGIDWRLLPAISMRESTGGKQACKRVSNSVFGYGSCKISFSSIDKSIEIVSASLGGNNPSTARHYDGKTTLQILRKYNSVIPNYPQEVVRIMKKIDSTDPII